MRRKLRRIVSSEPKPQRREAWLTGSPCSSSRRAASTLISSMARAGVRPVDLLVVPREAARAHVGALGQARQRQVAAQIVEDPAMQPVEALVALLQRSASR